MAGCGDIILGLVNANSERLTLSRCFTKILSIFDGPPHVVKNQIGKFARLDFGFLPPTPTVLFVFDTFFEVPAVLFLRRKHSNRLLSTSPPAFD